jgi:hypothetical protein
MEKGNVTADKIHYSRQSRATDAEIKALAEDIRDNGLQHPILVDAHSGLLLDGLNRFLAYKMLGWSVVPALFFDTTSEAADVLMSVRGEGILFSHQRNMELYADFKVLSREWDLRRRTGSKRGQGKLPPIESARLACARACGVSENSINRLHMLMNMAKEGNQEAVEVVKAIFASPPGSPILGYERISTMNNALKKMSPMDEEERVAAITNVVKAAETALDQAFRIGGMHTISQDNREAIKARLNNLTRSIRLINRGLRGRF